MGVLGRVVAYFGLVESQGRGTLHLHLIMWLANTPTTEEIHDLLAAPCFRERVLKYIRRNLRAYLPGLETAETVQNLPIEREAACQSPPPPQHPEYGQLIQRDELHLARSEQVHTCKPRRCLVVNSAGRVHCKRGAPFPCSEEDFVLESGVWGSKRLYGYINAWNPAILVNARCNNDIKLLTNGRDTKNITYYVTSYAAKKQGPTYNMSAVFAQGFNYHTNHPQSQYIGQLKENGRLLIFRLAHALNREQELAAPMVISYLMGWGDVYRSHTYTSIYWTSFGWELLKAFPDLTQQATYG
jgi:hypothetical protein